MRLNFLAVLYMSSYASQYGCGGSEAVHVCHDCPQDSTPEFAGTRRGGFINQDYLATVLAAPTTASVWNTGISTGKIVVFPKIRGSYDPGDPKELKGYGDTKVSYGARTMKWNFNDPDYYDNYAYYNEAGNMKNKVPFFLTSSLVHIFDKVATIKAKDPISEDIEEVVDWAVECQVVSGNLPSKHKVSAILSVFTCSNF